MRGRDQARAPGAELADPAVVGARVGLRELGVVELGFPEQPDGRVQHHRVDALGVEHFQPLRRIHAPVRRFAQVRALGIELHRAQIGVPHRAEGRREPLAAHDRRLAADLQRLEPVGVAHEAQGPIPVFRFEVRLPQIRRFEDVSVGVDGTAERQPLGDVHRLRHRHFVAPDGSGRHRVSAAIVRTTRSRFDPGRLRLRAVAPLRRARRNRRARRRGSCPAEETPRR